MSIWRRLCLVVYIVAAGWSVWQALEKPFRNFDMLGYAGAAISIDQRDPVMVHRTMLDEAQRVYPPDVYQGLVDHNPLTRDREAFIQQLPFYSVKPLYIGLVWALQKTGAGYAEATWIVSAFSFAGIMLLLALWEPQRLEYGAWLLVIATLAVVGPWPMRALAQYSTPDALGLLLLIATLLSWARARSVGVFLLLGALTLLARPDMLVILVLLPAIVALPGTRSPLQLSWKQAAVCIAGLVVFYALVQWSVGSYGWRKLFYYNFVNKTAYPATTPVVLTLSMYLHVVWMALTHIAEDIRLLPMAGLSFFAAYAYFKRPAAPRFWPYLLTATWAAYAAHFALFPDYWENRFSYPFYVLMLFPLAEMIPPYLRTTSIGQTAARFASVK